MKKSILTIVLVLIQLALLAQYSDIELIEKYNHVGKNIFKFKTGVTSPNTYYSDLSTQNYAGNAGNGTAYVLESLLRMYETTKDKAYLYEFIRHALELQINNYLI
jgi:hypothetical protein